MKKGKGRPKSVDLTYFSKKSRPSGGKGGTLPVREIKKRGRRPQIQRRQHFRRIPIQLKKEPEKKRASTSQKRKKLRRWVQ